MTGHRDPRRDLVVREAAVTDQSEIRRLFRELHADGAEAVTLPRVRQEARTFVATGVDGVVGLAVVTCVDYGHGPYGTIEELVVNPGSRGAGTGTALLGQCRAWLAALGAEVVFVSALDEGAARFYLSSGFARCTGPWLFSSLPLDGAGGFAGDV